MSWLDVLVSALVLTGALSCVAGAVGLLRFPDTLSRVHAATKPQTFGLLLILLGAMLRLDLAGGIGLLLVMLFQAFTAPVLSQVVGRSAYRMGGVDGEILISDEFANHLDKRRERSG